jgi:hypothetical protein
LKLVLGIESQEEYAGQNAWDDGVVGSRGVVE